MIYYHVYYKNLGLQVSLITQPAFLYNWARPHPSLIRKMRCSLAYEPLYGSIFFAVISLSRMSLACAKVIRKLTRIPTVYKALGSTLSTTHILIPTFWNLKR